MDAQMKLISDSAAVLDGTNFGEKIDRGKQARAVDSREAASILRLLNKSRSEIGFPPIQNDIRHLTARKNYANDRRVRAQGMAPSQSDGALLALTGPRRVPSHDVYGVD